MPEAVIVATARTPDRPRVQGIAHRRSAPTTSPRQIVERRADEGARSSTRNEVEDLMLGLRAAGRRAGLQHGPGRGDPGRAATTCPAPPSTATARRRCRRSAWPPTPSRPARATCSSRPASRCVSRYVTGARRRRTPRTRCSPTPRPASAARSGGGSADWTPPEGLPDIYIAMGQTAENVRQLEGRHARGDGRVRRPLAAAGGREASPTGSSSARSRRSRCPTARSSARTTGRAPAPPSRSWPSSSRCSGPTARSPPATPARSTTAPPPWSS